MSYWIKLGKKSNPAFLAEITQCWSNHFVFSSSGHWKIAVEKQQTFKTIEWDKKIEMNWALMSLLDLPRTIAMDKIGKMGVDSLAVSYSDTQQQSAAYLIVTPHLLADFFYPFDDFTRLHASTCLSYPHYNSILPLCSCISLYYFLINRLDYFRYTAYF